MKECVELDFFAKVFYPSHLKVHEGAYYIIGKRANLDINGYDSDLYRIEDGKARPLTASGDVLDYDFVDGGIVFASVRKEKDKEAIRNGHPLTVFQRLPLSGGEAAEYLRLAHQVVEARWLPGGKLLFRATLDLALQQFVQEFSGDMEKAVKTKKEQDEALSVIDEIPFWYNGKGFINKKRTALYLYDGSEARRLTDENADVARIALCENCSRALFAQQAYTEVAPLENALWQLDIHSGTTAPVKGIAPGIIEDYAFGPDGSILYLHSDPSGPHGWACGNPRLYQVDLHGETRLLDTTDGAYNYHSAVGSDMKLGNTESGLLVSEGAVSFIATLYESSHIIRYDFASGAFSQVTKAPGLVAECVLDGEGYAMLAMRENDLMDIYQVTAGGLETRMTALNADLMDAREIVTPLPVSHTNKDGVEIQGWVMPPCGYIPGKVYPAILNIHGGPKTVYGPVFFHEMQYWCGQGYAVLFCNPTGGDGRGEAFADIRGKYGTVDYDDIMGFVDTAVNQYGFISAVRMGVTGGSYGGFMTNWLIGHTDRFAAAASQRSISNWVGFADTSDIGYTFGRDQMQATPWDGEEALWKMSPLKYADRVKTPTLFIHSEEDYRCNMFEGIQMYYALRTFGVDTRLCLFKGENHELSRSGKPKNRVRRLQEITRWMDKYLKAPLA